MNVIHKLTLDMLQPAEMPRIQVKQGDAYSRRVQLALTADGEDWLIPTDAAVVIRYHAHDPVNARDAQGVYDSLEGEKAWSIAGNTVTITLAPQMLTDYGLVRTDVVLVQGETVIATANFEIYVNQAPVNDMIPCLQDYYGIDSLVGLEEKFDQIQKALDSKVTAAGGVMSGPLSMGGNRITGVPVPVSSYDAANRGFVEQTVATELRSVTNGLAAEKGAVDVLMDATTTTEVGYVSAAVATGKRYARIAVMAEVIGTISNLTSADLQVVVNGGEDITTGTLAGSVSQVVTTSGNTTMWADVSIFSGGHGISGGGEGDRHTSPVFFRHGVDLTEEITSIRVQTPDWVSYFGVGSHFKILGIRA